MKGKNVRPVHDRILVRPDAARTKTDGGIIIPDTVVERPSRGVAVAVGPGVPEMPTTTQVGDVVLFTQHAGTQITINDEMLLLMRESDLIGVEEQGDEEEKPAVSE